MDMKGDSHTRTDQSGVQNKGDVGELPDDLRVPLHELQADAAYLVGRVAVDGSTSGMILGVLETKLSHVAEAAYRLNGSRVDLLATLKWLDAHCMFTLEQDARVKAAVAKAEGSGVSS